MLKTRKLQMFGLLLIIYGCTYDDNFKSLDQTQKSGDKINSEFLTFNSQEEFDSLTLIATYSHGLPAEKLAENRKFVSLQSIFDNALTAEEEFLEAASKKYGAEAQLSRQDIGYSEFVKELINKGSIIIDEFELLDMNLSVPKFGYAVNSDGIVKIGEIIYQFKKEYVKKILDGDRSKINLLNDIEENDDLNKIEIIPVKRLKGSNSESPAGRSMAISSCDDTSSGGVIG